MLSFKFKASSSLNCYYMRKHTYTHIYTCICMYGFGLTICHWTNNSCDLSKIDHLSDIKIFQLPIGSVYG